MLWISSAVAHQVCVCVYVCMCVPLFVYSVMNTYCELCQFVTVIVCYFALHCRVESEHLLFCVLLICGCIKTTGCSSLCDSIHKMCAIKMNSSLSHSHRISEEEEEFKVQTSFPGFEGVQCSSSSCPRGGGWCGRGGSGQRGDRGRS